MAVAVVVAKAPYVIVPWGKILGSEVREGRKRTFSPQPSPPKLVCLRAGHTVPTTKLTQYSLAKLLSRRPPTTPLGPGGVACILLFLNVELCYLAFRKKNDKSWRHERLGAS